jgi:hypothetical protein
MFEVLPKDFSTALRYVVILLRKIAILPTQHIGLEH